MKYGWDSQLFLLITCDQRRQHTVSGHANSDHKKLYGLKAHYECATKKSTTGETHMKDCFLKTWRKIKTRAGAEEGADLIEYSLLTGILALGVISGLGGISANLNHAFNGISSSLASVPAIASGTASGNQAGPASGNQGGSNSGNQGGAASGNQGGNNGGNQAGNNGGNQGGNNGGNRGGNNGGNRGGDNGGNRGGDNGGNHGGNRGGNRGGN